ncbi:MAG TPA: thiol reductant ABC exporter subunit CydC [Syntrophomonas sp.]|nr:thiol reductant ABC exporter subunit CydC [Syntrophomonas sp.]
MMRLLSACYRSALRRNPLLHLLAVLLAGLTVLFSAGLLGLSAYLIALTSAQPLLAAISLPVTGVRFFGIFRAVLRYGERIAAHSNAFTFLRNLRVSIYTRLEPVLPDYRRQHRSGRFIGQIITDVENMQAGFLRILYPLLAAVLVLLCGFIWLWGYHPLLAWTFGLVFAVAAFLSPGMQRRCFRGHTSAAVEAKQQLYDAGLEMSYGKVEILANGRQQEWQQKIARWLETSRGQSRPRVRQRALEKALAVMFPNLAIVTGLIAVGIILTAGQLSPALLLVVPMVMGALFEAATPLMNMGAVLDETLASAARLKEIKGSEEQATEEQTPVEVRPDTADNGISLEKVSFGYRPGCLFLKEIDLRIEPGRATVILGPSGAGKSTLMNIILGFINDYTGKILIKGEDSRRMSSEQRLGCFSAAEQKPFFFNDSIRANLLIAAPGAGDDKMMAVLDKVGLAQFILDSPRGLDTQLAEMGKNLSGGELQRLALARSLLKPADFYLFDEPTAGLDTINEQKIISLLDELARDKGVLLITHRQSLLQNMRSPLSYVVLDGGHCC